MRWRRASSPRAQRFSFLAPARTRKALARHRSTDSRVGVSSSPIACPRARQRLGPLSQSMRQATAAGGEPSAHREVSAAAAEACRFLFRCAQSRCRHGMWCARPPVYVCVRACGMCACAVTCVLCVCGLVVVWCKPHKSRHSRGESCLVQLPENVQLDLFVLDLCEGPFVVPCKILNATRHHFAEDGMCAMGCCCHRLRTRRPGCTERTTALALYGLEIKWAECFDCVPGCVACTS